MKRTMTILGIITLLSSSSVFAKRLDLGGSITLRDGGQIIRINVGNEDRRDGRSMVRRISRLEKAVRALQNRVYELEDTTVNQELFFNCSVITCRGSASIHPASASNCKFFKVFSKESVRVYAFSGSEAERKALRKLSSDSDVKIIKEATISCEERR